jgi:dynein heavy chain
MSFETTLRIVLSEFTSPNAFQSLVMKWVERRRRGSYGPEIGKRLVIEVEDVNLASVGVIELMRCFLDRRGWWYRHEWIKFEDVSLLATLNRTSYREPSRFVRHFNELGFWEANSESLDNNPLFSTTILVLQDCRLELLPTPSRAHCQFTMRDVWSTMKSLELVPGDCSYWAFICHRVFSDRLPTIQDRNRVASIITTRMPDVTTSTLYSDFFGSKP